MLILWGIIIAYMLFIFIKGVRKVAVVKDSDDFLVAGRNTGWFALFCTMGATVIGGGASIGAIGKTYDWGVLMLLVSTGWYFHFIFSGLVVAPQFREAKLYTVAGYFGHRFGEGSRFLIMILSLLFSVFIVAAQMAAFGSVLSAIMPQFAEARTILALAILIGGMMVVVYSTAGGLMAVIHTDMYQFIILVGGFVITLCFCIPQVSKSYVSETHRFAPTRFARDDFQDFSSISNRLLNPDTPLLRHIRDGMPEDQVQSLREYRQHLDTLNGRIMTVEKLKQEMLKGADLSIDRQTKGKADKEKAKITEAVKPLKNFLLDQKEKCIEARKISIRDAFNKVLEEPDLYNEERFAGVEIRRHTEELQSRTLKGSNLLRYNLALIKDALPEEFNLEHAVPAWFFKPTGKPSQGWMFLITTFLAFLLGETFAPGYATRYCAGKNIRETRIGIAGVGFALAFTFPVVLFFIALYARIHFPDIDPQQALPMTVKQLNNPVIGGLIIGALLMAVMSSADSALNSSTAIFVKDLFEHQLGWKEDLEGRTLKIARICTTALGVLAIIVAVLWSDIIGLLVFTYHLWAPAVILPICVGALTKERSKAMNHAVFGAILTATVATAIYKYSPMTRECASKFDAAVVGTLVSAAAFAALKIYYQIFPSQGDTAGN